jgi:TATA-binding protein-associated factor Taf7
VKAARSGNLLPSTGKRANPLPAEQESLSNAPPAVASRPALDRRRRAVEEAPEEISEEEALERLAEFWDSLETADGSTGRKQKNKFREKADALRAAKAAAQTGGEKTQPP